MQVASISGADAEAADGAFEVAHFGELHAEGFERRAVREPGLHCVLPTVNRLHGRERLREPVAEQPRAHRRDGAVQCAVEGGVPGRIAVEGFEDFQVPQRGGVEHEVVAALVERQAREVLHVAAQVLREVVQRRARRAGGGGAALQTEAVQRRDLEVLAHGEDRRLGREDPVVVADEDAGRALQQRAERRGFAGVNGLRRTQALQLGEELGVALGLGRAEVAGG